MLKRVRVVVPRDGEEPRLVEWDRLMTAAVRLQLRGINLRDMSVQQAIRLALAEMDGAGSDLPAA